eukprot:1143635-Amphidinium_carterae.1
MAWLPHRIDSEVRQWHIHHERHEHNTQRGQCFMPSASTQTQQAHIHTLQLCKVEMVLTFQLLTFQVSAACKAEGSRCPLEEAPSTASMHTVHARHACKRYQPDAATYEDDESTGRQTWQLRQKDFEATEFTIAQPSVQAKCLFLELGLP